MSEEEKASKVEVNKWDSNAVKHAVDDGIKRVLEDAKGYRELNRLVDGRLGISALAVGFSLFALAWDFLYPFPASKPILIVCVLSYFALMGVLQLYTWYIEAGYFYVALDEDPTGRKPTVKWILSSSLKRFDHNYRLEMEVQVEGETRGTASLNKSIAFWIDDAGEVRLDLLGPDILKLHDSLLPDKKHK